MQTLIMCRVECSLSKYFDNTLNICTRKFPCPMCTLFLSRCHDQ